jgi:hypothetical protein
MDVAVEPIRLDDRRVAIALRLLVLAVVVLQRFAVPGIGTALCLPLALAIVAYLALQGALVHDATRFRLYLLAVGGCCTATLLSAIYVRDEWSLKSLALLVALYVPFLLRLRAELGHLYRPLLEFFNRLMVVAACVALLQWAAQVAGWTYRDLLDVVPSRLLLQTYNTTYPVHYGSPIMKANAIVFLEPSFFSQFLAVALIVQLLLGGRRWRLPLYAAALLTTVSGTGLVLAGAGLAVLAVRRGPAWTARVLLLLLLTGAVVQSTSLGGIIAARSTERTEQNSSANARFVAPYTLVAAGLTKDIPTLLVGRGPGIVSRPAGAAYFNAGRIEANYPVIPKLAAEYGVVAALLFVGFMIVAITTGTPSATVSVMVLLLYFLLSGSLLQPHTVVTAYIFTSLFARPGAVLSASPWPPRRPGQMPRPAVRRTSGAMPTAGGGAAR